MDEECLSQYILFVDWTNLVSNGGRFNYQFRQVYPWSMFPLFIINGWVSHQTKPCDFQFFAGFLRCDCRTIMKSFLKIIAHEYSKKFMRFLCKFPVESRAISLRNDFIIVRLPHLRNPAKNLRIVSCV